MMEIYCGELKTSRQDYNKLSQKNLTVKSEYLKRRLVPTLPTQKRKIYPLDEDWPIATNIVTEDKVKKVRVRSQVFSPFK